MPTLKAKARLEKSSSSISRSPRAHAAVRTDEYLYSQLIPYIGNKRKLLPLIARAVQLTGVGAGTFVDLFAGSGVVSRMAKRGGFRVIANDWEPYAFEINNCFVAVNETPEFERLGGAEAAFAALNGLGPVEGYVTRYLCPADDLQPIHGRERMFFTRSNGAKIDAIREQIAIWERDGAISARERSFLLGPLIFAVSYVSNTSGVFKGFHNGWGGRTGTALYRILSDLRLRMPVLFHNGLENEAWRMDAQAAAERLRSEGRRVEIAYLDPPYNQHPYGSNYHVLNTVALWDKPPVSRAITRGSKSAIRTDWRTERRSAYNYASASEAYDRLLATLDARFILTSYSTDGTIPLRTLIETAAKYGRLACVLEPYKRYRVSSQRMSKKPVNVEFVLIVDTSDGSSRRNASEIYDSILHAEAHALRTHPETALLTAGHQTVNH